jgi:adenylosuccinate synthase
MPISIVVGGQFGSEGKGKVALEWVRKSMAPRVVVVRVGGPNSGHTAYDRKGRKFALRQIPAGAIDRNVDVVFPAGSFIDVDVLRSEIALLDYPRDRIFVSPYANIITSQQKAWEIEAGLVTGIGSTGSGVGGAVMAAVAREASNFELHRHDALHCEPLEAYLCDTTLLMRQWLETSARVIIEGTQGFGLSLYDGGLWPKATSRCTTAASALAECGLSPIDVDDVTLVIRSFPIRVAGNSGPLPKETTWAAIAASIDTQQDLREYTTVTQKLRRVGTFDPEVVKLAIAGNNPTTLVLNHMDYIAAPSSETGDDAGTREFLDFVERSIGRRVDFMGFSPHSVEARSAPVA